MSDAQTSSHMTAFSIRAYNGRKLRGADLLEADRHLAACPSCRALALGTHDRRELVARVVESLEDDQPHLELSQLAAWVDGTAGDTERRAIESHLAWCASCEGEAKSLRSLANDLAEAGLAPPIVRRDIGSHGNTPRLWVVAAALAVIIGTGSWLAVHSNKPIERKAAASVVAALPVSPPRSEIADSGRKIVLRKDGTIDGIVTANADHAELLRQALVYGKIAQPDTLHALQGRSGTWMGSQGETPSFVLSSPLGTFVRAQRPQFHWSSAGAGSTYRVEIYNTRFELVASSPTLTVTEWTPDRDLARGESFRWQVVATREGQRLLAPQPPDPEAKFAVVGADAAARLDALDTAYSSHLMRALGYSREGLLDDARSELAFVQQLNPRSPEIAKIATQLQ
jgi:Putative zinc-finger